MKKILLVLVLFAGVTAMSFGRIIVTWESNTSFGNYTIEACDQPLMLAGEELKCYSITYENSPTVVKVFVDKEKKCKNYVVVTGDLAVMYTCNGDYFGVNKVGKKYRELNISTDDNQLDRTGYFRQKVISRGPTDEYDAIMLIASYYPELLKQSR
jgi:hypothetical protein